MFGDLACRHERFRHRNIVVFHVDDVELFVDFRVLFDVFREEADEFDDHLCHLVAGCGLCPENICLGLNVKSGVFAERIVFCDDVKRVQKLPLVFVHALDLDVKERIGVDQNPLLLFCKLCKLAFFDGLDFAETL